MHSAKNSLFLKKVSQFLFKVNCPLKDWRGNGTILISLFSFHFFEREMGSMLVEEQLLSPLVSPYLAFTIVLFSFPLSLLPAPIYIDL
jgi:hypothetical protein